MNIFENHDVYFEAILKRNKETHEDGHIVVFNYKRDFLDERREYFNECCDNHLSPHKALTFIDLEFN